MKKDWHPAKLLIWRRYFIDPAVFTELKEKSCIDTAYYIKRAEPTRRENNEEDNSIGVCDCDDCRANRM